MKFLSFALLFWLIAHAAYAHEESEIDVGRTSAGLLKVAVEFEQPLVLHPSIFPGISGYATGLLGIHAIFFDDPTNDFFQLSTSADLSFVLLAKDPGMEVWQDGGTHFMTNGESFHIGQPIFDTHPLWNLVSGIPGNAYSLTVKFHDANGIYPDSDPVVLSFTPILPPTLSIQDNSDDTVTITFTGSPEEEYIVQSATTLGPTANWTDVSTNTADADGSWTYTTSKSASPQRFFRTVIR